MQRVCICTSKVWPSNLKLILISTGFFEGSLIGGLFRKFLIVRALVTHQMLIRQSSVIVTLKLAHV